MSSGATDKHQEMLEMFQRKWHAQKIAIPTNDKIVMLRLRELHEPIVMFGEGPEDRRYRLRDVLARIGSDQAVPTAYLRRQDGGGADDDSMEDDSGNEDEDDDEVSIMQETHSQRLLDVRKWLMSYSLERARNRVGTAKVAAMEHDNENAMKDDQSNRAEKVSKWTSVISQIGDERPLSACAVAPDGKTLVTGAWGGAVTFWNAADGSVNTRTRGHTDRVLSLAINPIKQGDSVLAACCSTDGDVALWQSGKTEPVSLASHVHEGRANRVAFHPSGRLFGSTGDDCLWKLWDVETQQCLTSQHGHTRPVFGIAFHTDGNLVLTASVDTHSRVWDLRTGRCICTFSGHVRDVIACDWSPNGYTCATAGDDNSIRIWDLRKQQCAACIPGHASLISALKYDRERGDVLASASFDNTVKLWQMNPTCSASWKPLCTLSNHSSKIFAVDIADNLSCMVTASYDRTWKIWSSTL